MIALFSLFLLLAPPPPSSLDQVKAEPNPEHRARLAIDYAVVAERGAEAAYAKGDLDATGDMLKIASQAMEIARDSLTASGKKPGRSPGTYKYGEQRSSELLVRLGDLARKMDAAERDVIDGPMATIQEIHDAWFEGIMGKNK